MKKPRQPRYAQIFRDNEARAEVATEAWKRAIKHLEDIDRLEAPKVAIVDRYARAYAEYEELYPIAAEEGPVTAGPNGGDVFNFRWSAVEKLNDRLAKFEAKLGMDVSGEVAATKKPVSKSAADEYLD